MKKYLLILIIFCSSNVITQKVAAQNVSVNFQVFYDELSPYGMWVNNAEYGYVWVPNLGADFRPYSTNGYWVYTEDGWTWVSNYSWGWAPFHYGRWYNDDIYGSIWVPDNKWGPGWVNWRSNASYFGWSPMRPIFGVGNREYNGGWRFVRSEHFGRRDINNYYINRTNNVTIIKNTTVINNIHTDKIRNVSYNSGPNRIEVEKHTGKAIHSIAIKENYKPGQNINDKQLEIYRPQINKNDNVPFKPVPPQLMKMEDIKTRKQKITEGKNINASQTDKQRLQPSIQKIRNQPVNQQKQDVQQNKKQSLPPQKIDKPIRQQPIKQQPSLPQKNIPIPPSPEQSKTPIRKVQPSRNDEKMMQPRERPIPHADPYQEQEERRGPL